MLAVRGIETAYRPGAMYLASEMTAKSWKSSETTHTLYLWRLNMKSFPTMNGMKRRVWTIHGAVNVVSFKPVEFINTTFRVAAGDPTPAAPAQCGVPGKDQISM